MQWLVNERIVNEVCGGLKKDDAQKVLGPYYKQEMKKLPVDWTGRC